MKSKNHMKKFPPLLQFLFCFKSMKQKNSPSDKICFYVRFLNVEKTDLKLNFNKNNSAITSGENTTGENGIPFHLKNTSSIPKKTGIEKLKKTQSPILHLYKGIISTFLYRARLEFDSGLTVRFHIGTTS